MAQERPVPVLKAVAGDILLSWRLLKLGLGPCSGDPFAGDGGVRFFDMGSYCADAKTKVNNDN